MAITTTNLTCADCGTSVEHDTEAESWLKTTVLYDPDVVDIDNSGQICPETGDEHRTNDWDCGSGYCDPNTGCPACTERDHWTRAR